MHVTEVPRSGRSFDRGSWISLGIVLMLMVASATSAVAILRQVGDGCVLQSSDISSTTVGACVGAWETPLRPGDELLGFAGRSPKDSNALYQEQPPSDWIDGGTVTYRVRRGEGTLDLRVPLHRLDQNGILRAFSYGLEQQATQWNTAVFLGVLAIFVLAPRARAAQLLLVAIGGLTAVTTLEWSGSSASMDFVSTPIWLVATFLDEVWTWLFVPTILLFVLCFPRRVWPLARWPRSTVTLIYSVPLLALGAAFVTTDGRFVLAGLALGGLCIVVASIVITLDVFARVHDPVVRAQTGWLALGLAVGLAFWPLFFVLSSFFPGGLSGLDRVPWGIRVVTQMIPSLAFPVCVGIAITRYRLFEIDVIVRRTLIYSTLTLTLGLVYVAGIVLGRELVAPLMGSSDVAIVVSTLAIAALFTPVRSRIQIIIDKGFYRRKYDTGQVLEGFIAIARDVTDLDTLTGELLGRVDAAMQPEHVMLWWREPRAGAVSHPTRADS